MVACRATFVLSCFRSVRGVSLADYPEGDTTLRMHSPASTQQTIHQGGAARIDIAYVYPRSRLLEFLRGDQDTGWAGLAVTYPDGLVTGKIAVEEIDTGERCVIDFKMSIGVSHPVGVEVTAVANA
jgi:hypothetical protein